MKQIHLYIFIVLLFSLTVLTRNIPSGFHPDSLVYMSMARNLAEGEFSFWSLHFTNNIFNNFQEHPPLGIYLMSLGFSIFGDTILLDKLFSPFIALLSFILVYSIYKLISPKNSIEGALLAIFYFLVFPITSYTLENNLLEVPASLFSLGSVFIFLKFAIEKKNIFIYALLFNMLLLAAFLTKGPVTLFPLALIFFYYLLFWDKKSFKNIAFFYGLTIFYISIFTYILYSYEPANSYLNHYVSNQLLSSIDGSRGGGEYFKLTSQLFIDLGAISLLSFIAILLGKTKPFRVYFSPMFFLFLLIGLSASIPLELSPRQHDYYIFPSLIYFSIALSLLFSPAIKQLLIKLGKYKLIVGLNLVLFILLIATTIELSGTYKRHTNFHKDFLEAKVSLPTNASIDICSNQAEYTALLTNTEFTGNMQRFYKADLYPNTQESKYYLTTLSSKEACQVNPQDYEYIGAKEPRRYLLYRAKD